jgi:hypothetical protein
MPVLLKEEAFDDLANASARHSEFRSDGQGVLAELALWELGVTLKGECGNLRDVSELIDHRCDVSRQARVKKCKATVGAQQSRRHLAPFLCARTITCMARNEKTT